MSPFGSFLSNLKNYQVMFGVIIAKFKCLWKDGRCTVYEPAFVELPQPTEKALPQEDSSLKPTAILRNSRGLALEIYNPVSKDMLQCILEVLSNAE